jgi:hypothetical protein
LKAIVEELEANSKINNMRDLYRDINDFKKGYKLITVIVKDEKVDLLADSHSIMSRMINAGCRTIRCALNKLIISNKEELPEVWKESIKVPSHKKGNKTDCKNYRGISLLSTTYTIFLNILLSRLIPYTKEIIGDRQYGF